MNTLQEEIAFFRIVGVKAKSAVRTSLYKEGAELKQTIQSKAPVRTGTYKASWMIKKNRGLGQDSIASIQLYNPLIYASAIDDGIAQSSTTHPWAISNRKRPKNPNSKLIYSKTKVWSSTAPGGTVDTTFTPAYKKRLAQTLADSVMKVLK